jgi:hypothetical protein
LFTGKDLKMAKNDAKASNPSNGGAKDSKGAPMPLFYTAPVPLDGKKHGKLGLKRNFGFGFSRDVNAVPINMIEMPQICHYYPIAFSPDNNATPVAILGLRDNENLFIDEQGRWEESTYIPAYIRRYPFIFSELPGHEKLTLCVDMNSKIIEEPKVKVIKMPDGTEKLENAEQLFFDYYDDKQPSNLSKTALEFCKSYHAAAQQTMEFSQALAKSGLLTDRAAQINIAGNRRINFSGFKVVDEEKLAELKDKDFLEWRKKGWLPFLYAHLFSGAQWQKLTYLLNKQLKKEAA